MNYIDKNVLNDSIDNYRLVTYAQNSYGTAPTKGTSVYKGVHRGNSVGKWISQISKGPCITLGSYDSEEIAAGVYNYAAKRLFGEYAYLNNVPTVEPSTVVKDKIHELTK